MKFGKSEIITIVIIFLFVLGVGLYTFHKTNSDLEKSSAAGQALLGSDGVPTKFTDLEGNPVTLDEFNGKVRVVNSWATWCPFCVHELPDFSAAAEQFDVNDVVFIAINRGEQAAKVKSFLKKTNTQTELIYILDPEDSFYDAIGGFSMPETVFYNSLGEEIFHKRGVMTKEEIIKQTAAALQIDSE